MVTYIRSDLDFILDQIKIAEAHAAGQPLYGDGGLIPSYLLSWGLRTVDGSYNNLLPGQEHWGSSNQPFVELLTPEYRDAPTAAPPFFPPGSPDYSPSNNPASAVYDATLRTISNLIVDQSLGNPAAIMKALDTGGVVEANIANVQLVLAINEVFEPFLRAAFLANVALAANPSDPVLIAAAAQANAVLDAARDVRDAQLPAFGIAMDGDNVQVLNVSPDVGLSAPFNSWFTLFGQFFDHGLDLVNKGGSGTVFVPLQPDDPLYVEGANTNFMVLTRATVAPGTDGIMGTDDDVRPVNTTTPLSLIHI